MQKDTIQINGIAVDVYSLNTVIVGSGCAGFNAADCLHKLGQHNIALITEGVNLGTSRNTGSDKQTYYKLTLSGTVPDSVGEMAKTYFAGGAMHGDVALIEAALSAQCFSKLASIGVPFPHNKYGEYVGYKTDHDPRQRATSAGPLTSKFMTEKLEKQVADKKIKIFDGYRVIAILTQKSKEPYPVGSVGTTDRRSATYPDAVGLLAINLEKTDHANFGFTLFNCTNIVFATGGPAGMYADSVYPESQIGASGIAYEAGAVGQNLTESQFGLASIKFRWNVSGTYQQVIPRYISTDRAGNDPREFLAEYFASPGQMMNAVFLKGYQWPFDPRKIADYGSSLIDILVYNETQIKGRRVWMDFRHNPASCGKDGELDFSLCNEETHTYLKNSNALFGRPIDRLAHMNPPAIQLYKDNGIDLYEEMLEIAVCAQHNNGGLFGNIWSESNVRHFFPVGEANGVFGVYRPGGSALNSTQVSSLRAAQFIAANYTQPPLPMEAFVDAIEKQFLEKWEFAREFTQKHKNEEQKTSGPCAEKNDILEYRQAMQKRMTDCGAHIRSLEKIEAAIRECLDELKSRKRSAAQFPDSIVQAFINRDILITQYVYFCAIREYIHRGGGSRGSYLIQDAKGDLPIAMLSEEFRFSLDSGELRDRVCEIRLDMDTLECRCDWKPVRPIPTEDHWFETVWAEYRMGQTFAQ
ncbi:MAG: FAD-binding protein [Planctomycetaceae bacterium]|nr:FAD-binding protein [Planctomycetaceae bacterium]